MRRQIRCDEVGAQGLLDARNHVLKSVHQFLQFAFGLVWQALRDRTDRGADTDVPDVLAGVLAQGAFDHHLIDLALVGRGRRQAEDDTQDAEMHHLGEIGSLSPGMNQISSRSIWARCSLPLKST
jgi:hypothetical protein